MAASRSTRWSSRLSNSAPSQSELKPADRVADTLLLDSKVTAVKGVTPARAQALEKLKVRTVRDLLTHFPRRYMDLSHICTIAEASIGEACTIAGEIFEVKLKRPRPKLPIVEVTLRDATGVMMLTFFHMPWLAKKLKPGMRIAASGKVAFDYGFKRLTNPYYEELAGREVEGKMLAVHPATEKLQAGHIRRLMQQALEQTRGMLDPVPTALRVKRGLMSRGAALATIHEPHDAAEVADARRRLVYDEVFLLQLFLMREGQKRARRVGACAHVPEKSVAALEAALPFQLTSDQRTAVDDLFGVMGAPVAADHMVMGDVGTGKTMVAAFGVALAKDSGGQAMIMAPTEILAEQHARTLGALFDEAGIRHALLTGSTSAADRARILQAFAAGEVDVLIGTHALIEDDVTPARLTFAVIDEQQRFGVDQRSKLLAKGTAPDALYMTATPIPRSLALTLFGNLTHSYIKEKPLTGSSRTTTVYDRAARGKAYDAARAALARGEQVYVVCPLVGSAPAKQEDGNVREDDEPFHPEVAIDSAEDFDAADPASATKEAQRLARTVFIDHQVGLLHGGLPAEEKRRVMDDFARGRTQVLVTTTVIEVGVDVPKATVMIVEDADRFGLSQLHQLRGRVGRGGLDAQVFFISSSKMPNAVKRLEALESSDDGFQIAAYDLSLRREGDILGNKQAGTSSLKLVNITLDADVIDEAHEDARALLDADPDLTDAAHAALAREVRMTFSDEMQVSGG